MDRSHFKTIWWKTPEPPLNSSFTMAPLLQDWIGERWSSRSIQVDNYDLCISENQQIVDSLLPDITLKRPRKKSNTGFELMVVDRDVFALELARE